MGKKIATCSYCGTRSVLVFDGARHELTCSACGAPLHDMKFMPQPVEKKKKKTVSANVDAGGKEKNGRANVDVSLWRTRDVKTRKKKKKRSPMFKRLMKEFLDEIEDIFD